MSGKILVVYGSRYGCTKEIAQKMGDIFEEDDFECHVINLNEASKKNWPLIDVYDGVIIGSGIQIMQWVGVAKKYLKEIAEELQKGRVKFGVFVSSASAAMDKEQAIKDYITKIMVEMNLKPDISEAFAGVLDFSDESNIGKIKKGMLKLAAKGMSKDKEGLEFDYEGCNDLRDWPAIEKFAHDFANILR